MLPGRWVSGVDRHGQLSDARGRPDAGLRRSRRRARDRAPTSSSPHAAGLPVANGIVVDSFGRAGGREDVFAAGDVAAFPDAALGGRAARRARGSRQEPRQGASARTWWAPNGPVRSPAVLLLRPVRPGLRGGRRARRGGWTRSPTWTRVDAEGHDLLPRRTSAGRGAFLLWNRFGESGRSAGADSRRRAGRDVEHARGARGGGDDTTASPQQLATGESVWIDYLSRELLDSGELARLLREDSVVGITSNPTIFQRALAQGDAYDPAATRALPSGLEHSRISSLRSPAPTSPRRATSCCRCGSEAAAATATCRSRSIRISPTTHAAQVRRRRQRLHETNCPAERLREDPRDAGRASRRSRIRSPPDARST